MDPLNFKLSINVPETSIIHSVITLVCERMKRIDELLHEAKTIEINLHQSGSVEDENLMVVAEIKLAHPAGLIHEKCESKMWDAAFFNALDQVKNRIENAVPISN